MQLDETQMRNLLVAEAMSWIGTPYISNAAIKGKGGGTDCAMILLKVYQNCGLIPEEYDPRPYPSQWHVHQNAEVYMSKVTSFAHEVAGPPERAPLPGDVVMFRLGKLFCHGAIITSWPYVIHALGNDKVMPEDISKATTGKRALWNADKRFFSYWAPKV